jgi:hypothetical protein
LRNFSFIYSCLLPQNLSKKITGKLRVGCAIHINNMCVKKPSSLVILSYRNIQKALEERSQSKITIPKTLIQKEFQGISKKV